MNALDIELTNKFYNNKQRKKHEAFNIQMQKKREKRLNENKTKPLTDREKHLFEHANPLQGFVIPCNGFYKSNGSSHVLLMLTNTNIETFYNETLELCKKFPSDSVLPSLMDDSLRQSVLSMASPSRFGVTNVACVSPTDPNLSKYVKRVSISAFSLSFDSICVDFEIIYTSFFLTNLNRCLISDFDNPVEYSKTTLNGKETISFSYTLKETKRSNYVDDVLFEIKSRIFDFIKHNYSAFDFKGDFVPYSIDEYRTNLNYHDRFIGCYGYVVFDENTLLDLSNQTSQTTKNAKVLMDFNETIRHPFYNLNRGRLLFFADKDDFIYLEDTKDFVLMFFLQNKALDLYKKTLKEKYDLFERLGTGKYRLISNAYKCYSKLCLKASNHQIALNLDKLAILPYVSNSKYLNTLFDYLKKEVASLNKRNSELDDKINNLLSSKNNSISIWIALLAFLVSIISVVVAVLAIIIPYIQKIPTN